VVAVEEFVVAGITIGTVVGLAAALVGLIVDLVTVTKLDLVTVTKLDLVIMTSFSTGLETAFTTGLAACSTGLVGIVTFTEGNMGCIDCNTLNFLLLSSALGDLTLPEVL